MPKSSPNQSGRLVVDGPRHGLHERDELLGHRDRHHEIIEASFDRAEAYERLGDLERALDWLDRAAALCGGLPPEYQLKRARWARASARRPRPAAGDWRDRGSESGQPAPAS